MTYLAFHNTDGEKLFPIQGDHDKILRKREGREYRSAGYVTWEEAEEAYVEYTRLYPGSARDQSLERLAERYGFGWDEIETFLGHRATAEQPYSGIQR